MKIFAFGASLRKDSWNKKLVRVAAASLAKLPETQVDLAEFNEFEMPVYNGDIEESTGLPLGTQQLVQRIRAAQAVVISTPEYNGSIPGALKNAIDWVSRDDDNPFEKKPVLLLAASPGALGGVRSLAHTRIPFEAMGAFIYPQGFGLARAGGAFDEKEALKDPQQLARLEDLLKDFTGFARRFS